MTAPAQPRPREGTVFHWPGDKLKYRDISHDECVKRAAAIRKYHMDVRNYSDIAYNLLACPHGEILPGRGVDKMSGANGTETQNANSRWGAVLFLIGQGEAPTDEQYVAAEEAAKQLGGADRLAHSDVRSTACPGDIIRHWVKAGTPVVVPPQPEKPTPPPTTPTKSIRAVALEVIAGKWGSGSDRKARLTKAGYNYNVVQTAVNALLNVKPSAPRKTVSQLADEVIKGFWGNGDTRERRLKAAGYDPKAVQAEVNRVLTGKSGSSRPKTAYQVAQEVIAGKWGVGSARKRRLRAAGYNYQEVQNVVNRLLK